MQITAGSAPEEQVWHCGGCYNILHFSCASIWADSNREYTGSGGSIAYWSCPQCMQRQYDAPKATCWCGKLTRGERGFMNNQLSTEIPNSCLSSCGKVGECIHENRTRACDKPCHPGSCDSPCGTHCIQQLAAIAKANAPPNWWRRTYQKIRSRWQSREDKGTRWVALATLITVVVYYVAWGLFAHYSIKGWTQPLSYRQWTEKWAHRYIIYRAMLISTGVISGSFVIAAFAVCCGYHFYKRVTHLLKCNELSTKKIRKLLTMVGIWAFIAFGCGAYIAMVPLL